MSEFPGFGQKEASLISLWHSASGSQVGDQDWFEDTDILELVPDKS